MNSSHASLGMMFRVLMRMQLARLRRHWRPYVVVSAVMPAGIVLLLNLTNPAMPEPQRAQIVSGAMLLSQSIASIVMLSQYVAWLKVSRALDHYRVMPISLEVLVIALTTAYSFFAWPGIVLIAFEGRYLDQVPIHFSWLIVPLLLLAGVTMGSLGTIMGLLAPDEGLAGLFGNLVMMGILFLGMVPLNVMGPWAISLWILPSTGALDILRGLMFSQALHPLLRWWLAMGIYAIVGLGMSAYFIKRPS